MFSYIESLYVYYCIIIHSLLYYGM